MVDKIASVQLDELHGRVAKSDRGWLTPESKKGAKRLLDRIVERVGRGVHTALEVASRWWCDMAWPCGMGRCSRSRLINFTSAGQVGGCNQKKWKIKLRENHI